MNQREIRVGIVGPDSKAGWAKVSHVPAIKGLPCVKLTGRYDAQRAEGAGSG
jgi:hypothetical protein